ncbi:flavin reductase family protein [Cryptosporangium sp. NPDC048952]|uniref:flavin reductase family protein n=1 Tax=Cryptosporangium sp. NPDC048952 TaxID=3363961 RepID=UPI003713D62A
MTTDTLRTAFGSYPTGVVAVCGMVAGERVGMAMSTFVPISLDPPLVGVCVQRTSRTWPLLRTAERLGISVLAHHHAHAARALAARDGDRFAGIDLEFGDGTVHVAGSTARLVCTVENEVDAGDHVLAVLRVHTASTTTGTEPLVFHRSAFVELAGSRR